MKKYLFPFCFVVAACTGTLAQNVAKDTPIVINLAKATCTALETQPEPTEVVFTCTLIDAAAGEASSFTVKVPAAQAAAFSAVNGPSAAKPK